MLRLFFIFILALCANPATAQGFWEYGSWRIWVQEFDTGEDLRRTCTALTGGDRQPSVVISVSNGDAGPPDYCLAVIVQESVPRGYPTVLRDG